MRCWRRARVRRERRRSRSPQSLEGRVSTVFTCMRVVGLPCWPLNGTARRSTAQLNRPNALTILYTTRSTVHRALGAPKETLDNIRHLGLRLSEQLLRQKDVVQCAAKGYVGLPPEFEDSKLHRRPELSSSFISRRSAGRGLVRRRVEAILLLFLRGRTHRTIRTESARWF